MKKMLISSALAVLCATSVFAGDTVKVTGIRDAGLELGSQNLKEINYISTQPVAGQVEKIKKSFYSAPPMIPHNIKGMTPIRIGANQCLSCHKPVMAKALKIEAIPDSHFVDTFKGGKKTGKRVSGSRYNCTQCHAPQTTLDPVVENKFKSLRR